MEDINEFDVPKILVEMIATEKENFDDYELGTDEHKMAVQNIKTLVDALQELDRVYCENDHNMGQLDLDREVKMKQLDLDMRRLEVEKDSSETEQLRYQMDLESRGREMKLKEYQAYAEIAVGIGGLILGFAGICVGKHQVDKTLDVNLESVITDRDAVNAANRLLDRFIKK